MAWEMPKTTEGSPLLEGATGPMRDWNYGDQPGSGRALLGESRRRRRQGAGAVSDGGGGGVRRNWRVSAGVAGALMFAMALAGLVAIFSTIQGERTPRSASPLQQMKDVAVEAPAAAAAAAATPAGEAPRERADRGRESRERCERHIKRDCCATILVDCRGGGSLARRVLSMSVVRFVRTCYVRSSLCGGLETLFFVEIPFCGLRHVSKN